MAKKEANIVIRLRDRASSRFRKLGGSVRGLLKPIGLVTGALGGLISLAGGAFLFSAIRNTGNFGEQLSILRGLTRGTAEDMAALEAAAREAGATTRFSALEAGQGLEELSRGGQSAAEAIDTLNPVLQLAAGNNQSVAESAQQVITSLNQYGLAADQAGRVSDVFTRAAQRSAQTTQQLARVLQAAGPVAAQAGLSFEQTAALAGRLADAGFRGERGGTALRNALSQLADPASKFSKELAALGIDSDNFVEVLGQLQARGDDANKAIRALGLEASPAIQALVSGGSDALNQLIGDLNNAGGAAGDAAAAMEDNLPGAFRNLKSAFSELQIALTQPLTEEIKEGVFDLADTIRNFAGSDTLVSLRDVLVETFQAGRQAVQEFVAGIDLVEVGKRIRDFVAGARERIADFKQQAFNLQAAFTQIVGVTNVFVGSLRAAFNGLGVVIGSTVVAVTRGSELILRALDFASAGLISFAGKAADELEFLRGSFQETTGEFAAGFLEASEQVGKGFEQMAARAEQAGEDIAEGLDKGSKATEEAEAHQRALKEALIESGLSAEQVGDSIEDAGEKAEAAGEKMSGAGDGAKEAADKTKKYVGQINGEWTELEGSAEGAGDAQKDAADATDEAADASDRASEASKRSTSATRESTSAQKENADATDELTQGTKRLGGAISLGSEAQAVFNEELAKFGGVGNALFINQFTRSLEAALEVQRKIDRAQGRLNELQRQGVDVTTNFASANRELRFELLELRGETEKLAEARERDQRAALEQQIALAQAQGDEDRVQEIREFIRLQERVRRERERQAEQDQRERDQRQQDTDQEADAAERLESASRGGTIRQEIRVIIESGIGRDGREELSQADLDRIVDRVLQKIDIDRNRT